MRTHGRETVRLSQWRSTMRVMPLSPATTSPSARKPPSTALKTARTRHTCCRSTSRTAPSPATSSRGLMTREARLPIQEDETALVLIAIRNHYARTGDWGFVSPLYHPMIVSMANFLVDFRDPETGLPSAEPGPLGGATGYARLLDRSDLACTSGRGLLH